MEFGQFIAFLAVPIVTLIFMGKIRTWGFAGFLLFLGIGALSFIMLGGLALAMAAGYDVKMTNYHAAYNQTAIERDGAGVITGSIETQVPAKTDYTPIIDQYQDIWASIFTGALIIFGLLYFYVMIAGGS